MNPDAAAALAAVKEAITQAGTAAAAHAHANGLLGAALAAAIQAAAALEVSLEETDPEPVVELKVVETTPRSVTVQWTTTAEEPPASWRIERDGVDLGGTGRWATVRPGVDDRFTFSSLLAATAYTITLTPDGGQPVQVTATTKAAEPGPGGPVPGTGSGTTAAERLGWGDPDPISDDFTSGRIDPARWQLPGVRGQGWPGHNGNGRRMPENAVVEDGVLVLRGDASGDTGWIRQNKVVTYGRWEIRSRSMNTGASGGLYHPLHLIWPSPDQWPENGELDFLEYTDPSSKTAGAWLHYPHRSGIPIQQAGPFTRACDMTAWHNFAFEWSRTGVRAWIDGEPWYEVKDGGGPLGRKNIQDMPAGSLTIQLDAFQRAGLRPARFEIDWVRFYPLR